MMFHDYLTFIAAGIVLFASFCRLTKMDDKTLATVRLGVCFKAGASILVLVAPFLWQWKPDLIHCTIFVGLAVYQVATRKAWQHGVPHWFVYGK